MSEYERLLEEISETGLYVAENVPFQSKADGLIIDDIIGLSDHLKTTAEKADVLAEELGHHYTTVGNILDQANIDARKQERKARLWAYDKRIGLSGFIQGFRQHCHSRYELAECLGVTEEFLQEAIECYREKYGCMVELDGYIIIFEPRLAVMEKL